MIHGSGIVVQIVLVMAVGILAEQQAIDSTMIPMVKTFIYKINFL